VGGEEARAQSEKSKARLARRTHDEGSKDSWDRPNGFHLSSLSEEKMITDDELVEKI
jgi:hypothetical protein